MRRRRENGEAAEGEEEKETKLKQKRRFGHFHATLPWIIFNEQNLERCRFCDGR